MICQCNGTINANATILVNATIYANAKSNVPIRKHRCQGWGGASKSTLQNCITGIGNDNQGCQVLVTEKAKFCFKRPNFLFYYINFYRILKKANYLKILLKFQGNRIKKVQICYFWPRKGQPGNPDDNLSPGKLHERQLKEAEVVEGLGLAQPALLADGILCQQRLGIAKGLLHHEAISRQKAHPWTVQSWGGCLKIISVGIPSTHADVKTGF